MIRISNIETVTDGDIRQTIPKLINIVTPVLNKRAKLHAKYSRGAMDAKVMYSEDKEHTKVSYEKFLTDISAGYLSGKPIYSVASTSDEEKQKLLHDVLDKEIPSESYKEEMEILIDYIVNYNDDETEHHDLVHDILELTSCYEVLYENKDNEIIYSRYNPLNTVAIWDYNIPANLLALVRVWEERDINGSTKTMCELTDKNGTITYSITDNFQEVKEVDNQNHNWGDVPAIVVETDFSIFEPCEDIIVAEEQLIQNMRNIFQYNDSDCKLKFSGYMPQYPAVDEVNTYDDDGNIISTTYKENEARKTEDEYIEKAKTLYVGENGDVDWIQKPLDSNGAVEILKTYMNLMFQLAGIPNTSDLAFNSADLNASAIDRKFYIMNMMTANVMSELKKAYQRRWELVFGRINLKKGTNYDFRDIDIQLPKNLPSTNDEKIDSMMKLQNILSEQTVIEELGYNYIDERNKKDSEAEDNIVKNMERMAMIGGDETDVQKETSFEDSSKLKTTDELIETVKENKEQEEKTEDEEKTTAQKSSTEDKEEK